jgi:hypothetical protein
MGLQVMWQAEWKPEPEYLLFSFHTSAVEIHNESSH